MIIYKATKKNEPIDEEPKTWQTLLVQTVAFLVIVGLGAILGALVCLIFALSIPFIASNGLDGFSSVLNNNITYLTAFGAVLFALMLIIE